MAGAKSFGSLKMVTLRQRDIDESDLTVLPIEL
jgi:hypothetical protein